MNSSFPIFEQRARDDEREKRSKREEKPARSLFFFCASFFLLPLPLRREPPRQGEEERVDADARQGRAVGGRRGE